MIVFALNLLVLIAFIVGFYKGFPRSNIKVYFWPTYIFKLLCGIFMGWYLLEVNPARDTFMYVEDAHTIAQWGRQNPMEFIKVLWQPLSLTDQSMLYYQGQPRAIFMAWLLSPLALITQGNFWLVNLYVSTLSFIGIWTLVDKLTQRFPNQTKAILFSFLIYPSFVFWTSGITKEAAFLGLFCFLVARSWPYWPNFQWRWSLCLLLLVAWTLFRLKYYNAAVALPLLGSALVVYRLAPNHPKPGLLISILFILLLPLVSLIHPNLSFGSLAEIIQQNALYLASKTHPQALVEYIATPNAISWILINLPKALFMAFFGPFVGNIGSIFQNIVVVEHLLLFMAVIGTLKSKPTIPWKSDWFLPLVLFMLILGAFLTLSTPNFGTLMRYKAIYLPFWVLLLLAANSWWKSLSSRLP